MTTPMEECDSGLKFLKECEDYILWVSDATFEELQAFIDSDKDYPEWKEDRGASASHKAWEAEFRRKDRQEVEAHKAKVARLRSDAAEVDRLRAETIRIASSKTVPDLFPNES